MLGYYLYLLRLIINYVIVIITFLFFLKWVILITLLIIIKKCYVPHDEVGGDDPREDAREERCDHDVAA